jgi:hypothetical protein
LDWLQHLIGADRATFDTACTSGAPLQEHRLYRLATAHSTAPEVMVAGMITMLALILLRFEQPELWFQSEWVISRMGAEGRLSVDGFVKTMHRRLQSGGISISEITRSLYADYIILQHQLVANSKLPDKTFRFQREGDRLRFYNLWNSLTFMDSRFDALSTTLHELGLCGDLRRPSHPLTTDGQLLLANGDLA